MVGSPFHLAATTLLARRPELALGALRPRGPVTPGRAVVAGRPLWPRPTRLPVVTRWPLQPLLARRPELALGALRPGRSVDSVVSVDARRARRPRRSRWPRGPSFSVRARWSLRTGGARWPREARRAELALHALWAGRTGRPGWSSQDRQRDGHKHGVGRFSAEAVGRSSGPGKHCRAPGGRGPTGCRLGLARYPRSPRYRSADRRYRSVLPVL